MRRKLRILLLSLVLATPACTQVTADINNGTITVLTFMTSRQDVEISRAADGAVTWKTARSTADTQLAEAVLNVSKVAARTAGVQ